MKQNDLHKCYMVLSELFEIANNTEKDAIIKIKEMINNVIKDY